jgi:dTDP-glucose pyrophosphorylase/CBS domain-containing protein
MIDLDSILMRPDATIRAAIATIEVSPAKTVIVVDGDRRPLGSVTDGDIRRGLLRGAGLDDAVTAVMHENPHTVGPGFDRGALLHVLKGNPAIRCVPVLDAAGRVVGAESRAELLAAPLDDNWVVLMAGGKGTRLRPLTEDLPKPMLPVGGRPLLETSIERLVRQGFSKVYISVNYKAHVVQEYFGDGRQWGLQIAYLEEHEPLGTAGSLSLLPDAPSKPLLVANGDILTNINYEDLLQFHEQHDVAATMCVRNYRVEVPYGVVDLDGHSLVGVAEKPTTDYFVNAGIYVLDPAALAHVTPGERCDMTTLFERLIRAGDRAAAFPIREYWWDVGQLHELEQARGEYSRIFG